MRRGMVHRATLILLVCVSMTASLGGIVNAAATAPANSGATDTLKISPVESEISVLPGASYVVKTYVTNITNSAIYIQPIENDFIAGNGENGTPYIVLGANSYAPTHSLKRFMLPLSNVTVQPGERKEVDVTITVPRTAQPGGYYGAVRFAPASENADQSVNLQTSAASLILLTVPGPYVEKLALTNFDVEQSGSVGSNFSNSKNLALLVRFQNQGNIHESPFGQIYVKKGNKVVYLDNFNYGQPQATILPDSARRWDIPLKGIGGFGQYVIGATFTYGAKGQTIDITKTIWIIPFYIYIAGIVLALVIIGLIAFTWVYLRSRRRRRNHSKARRR